MVDDTSRKSMPTVTVTMQRATHPMEAASCCIERIPGMKTP